MADYVDLILCMDGTVLEVPRFSHSIDKDDLILDQEGVLHTVKDRITINRNVEEYRFIAELYDCSISCASAVYIKSELKYPEEVTADVGNE